MTAGRFQSAQISFSSGGCQTEKAYPATLRGRIGLAGQACAGVAHGLLETVDAADGSSSHAVEHAAAVVGVGGSSAGLVELFAFLKQSSSIGPGG